MDSSPTKRRKTSPTTAFAVNVLDNQRPLSRDGRQTSPGHASFMSPTRSSLARFNPSLLPPSRSSRTNSAKSDKKKSLFSDQNPILEQRTGAAAEYESKRDPQVLSQSEARVGDSNEGFPDPRAVPTSPRRPQSTDGGMATPPRRRLRTPGQRSSSPTKLGLRRLGAITDIPASPPEAVRETEDHAQRIVNEQLDQELQANAPYIPHDIDIVRKTHGRRNSQQDAEPELPLTPTQLGLEPVPEPPKGLLFSSPSRRSTRRKRAPAKSSPLKPGDPAPDSLYQNPTQQHIVNPTIEVQDSQPVSDSIEDPELSKKRAIREQLSTQLEKIQHDITQLEAEVSRTQNPTLSGTASQEEIVELMYNISHLPPSKPAN